MGNFRVTRAEAFANAQAHRQVMSSNRADAVLSTLGAVGAHLRKELQDITIDIARVHDAKFILRVTAKEVGSGKQLKGHLEMSLTETELVKLLRTDQFWSGDYLRSLSQFTGYLGEAKVMEEALTGSLTLARSGARGQNAATYGTYTFRPGSVMSLQKPGSGHGLDILGYKTAPPPPGWVVADVKTTARAAQDLAGFRTPKTAGLSGLQRQGKPYAVRIIEEALESARSGENIYDLTTAQRRQLRRLISEVTGSNVPLTGMKIRVGLQEGFALATNSRYPQGIKVGSVWF